MIIKKGYPLNSEANAIHQTAYKPTELYDKGQADYCLNFFTVNKSQKKTKKKELI